MITATSDEQHDVAGGREAVEAGLVLLVDHRGDDVGGEARAAAGHRPDQVERAQAADEADRMMTVTVAGRTQRQRDVPEVLAAGGAVDRRGLVIVLRDRDDAGDVDDGREADALPDVDQRDREQREARVGEPARALDAEQRERLVDHALGRMHHHGEGDADADGRDQHRKEDDGAQVAAADDRAEVSSTRQQQAEHDLQARR